MSSWSVRLSKPTPLCAAAMKARGSGRRPSACRWCPRCRASRDVVGAAPGDFAGMKSGWFLSWTLPHRDHFVQAVQPGLGVMAHAARIVVEDVREVGHCSLISSSLSTCSWSSTMAKRIAPSCRTKSHFRGHRILVHRHRHAAQHLRRAHRPVQARAVVADDGQVVAALEAEFGQAAGHGAHFLGHLAPGPGLPDAEIFLARRRTIAARGGVIQQQTGKRIERGRARPDWDAVMRFLSSSTCGADSLVGALLSVAAFESKAFCCL
jgi:hypothetical protein